MDDYTLLLNDLSALLRRLHKALLDAEAENFGAAGGPLELLDFVINHEHFAWLRHLSELMVDVDERRDSDEPVDAEQVGAFRVAVESLVGPRAETVPHFRERYTAMLQQSPDAAVTHGDLRRLLGRFPNVPETPVSAARSVTRKGEK